MSFFRPFSLKPAFRNLCNRFTSFCDSSTTEDSNTLIEQANAKLEEDKPKIRTPLSFDGLKNTINNAGVSSFDGFRMVVQKQINLNAVATHFYWLGSQLTGQQIYQYRLILPYEDGKMINVGTNVDLSSVEGEVKVPLSPHVLSKTTFALTPEQNQIQSEIEITGSSSSSMLQISKSSETSLAVSYMQSITPSLSLGGMTNYSSKAGDFTSSLGGSYSRGDHSLYAQWDNNLRLLYLRRVNPNRVNLSTDLLVDESGNSRMSIAAEYILKQSKLQMSVDSNLHLKSSLETSVMNGFQLQFCAEMSQLKDVYRFGYGVMMG